VAREFNKVGVVGLGTMGAGIVEVFARGGIDVLAVEIDEVALYLESREPGLAPVPLLEHLVTAGYLGRKAGRGFRDHSAR
jgi:3-hydroxyacyl-CoA dehydrogenase